MGGAPLQVPMSTLLMKLVAGRGLEHLGDSVFACPWKR
jgi:hypothetical protein